MRGGEVETNKFLDAEGLAHLWGKVRASIDVKQNKLTGQPGQVVGFDADGAATAVRGLSNPNLLDNAYWANKQSIINQRGQTEYTCNSSDVYFIDRWTIGWWCHAQLQNDGILFSNTENNPGGTINIQQKIPEEIRIALQGKTVTASILYSTNTSGIYFGFFNTNQSLEPTGDEVGMRAFTTIYDGNDKICIRSATKNASIKVYAIKLELGSVQTLAHKEGDTWVLNDPPPSYALELAKCQRYFERCAINRRFMNLGSIDRSLINISGTIPFIVVKRSVPNVRFEYSIAGGANIVAVANLVNAFGFTNNSFGIGSGLFIDIHWYEANSEL